MNKPAGVVILSAGNSSRMHSPKPLLPAGNHTFIGKIASTYHAWGCREIVLVLNREMQERSDSFGQMPEKVTFVLNEHPEKERFHSVKLGLGAIRNPAFCFLQDVDNPFLDQAILDLIFSHRSETGYVSPVFMGRGGHPVLLNRSQIKRIAGWPRDDANLKEVLATMDCIRVEMPDHRVLININTPEEYTRLIHPTPGPSHARGGDMGRGYTC